MTSSSNDQEVEVSRQVTQIYSSSRAYPDGITDTVAYSHATKDSFKVPLTTLFGANTPGGANEPWKEKSSAHAYGTNMPNSVSKPVFK